MTTAAGPLQKHLVLQVVSSRDGGGAGRGRVVVPARRGRRRHGRRRGRSRRRRSGGRGDRGGGRRGEARVLGEVELGAAAAEAERGLVVGARRGLGCLERAEPHARRLVRVPDLRRPLPPRPLPHAAEPPLATAAAAARLGGGGRGRVVVAVLHGRRAPLLSSSCVRGHDI